MPRRPAPTPLRLVPGPLPKRGESKHTLPSIPRPVLHAPSRVIQVAVPRERTRVYIPSTEQAEDARPRIRAIQPVLTLPSGASSPVPWSSASDDSRRSRGHSRHSSISSTSSSRSSGENARSPEEENPDLQYGPWVKHARGSSLPFNPSTLVMPPQPVAINPLPVW